MPARIKILLADDTLIAREGWKKILETVDDIEVIGEATTAQETPIKVKELRPDILLTDLKWFEDETAGVAAIAQIRRESPQTKVVAITAYPHLIAGARRTGAEAALPKGFSKSELVATIRAVYKLESIPLRTPGVQICNGLSDRETEMLTLMAQGLTDKEIASRLTIAESTAKNHVANILRKLDAANRTQAVAIGFQKGILKREGPQEPTFS
jgi:DNA-binding NarL/FixJ family response regulator